MSAARPITAPCPRCGQPATLDASNPWRPFCKERCKLIDFGKWASEAYAIPAESQNLDEDNADDETHKLN